MHQIVDFQYGMAVQSKGLAVTEDILTAHPDLAGIFCSNEAATVGAVLCFGSEVDACTVDPGPPSLVGYIKSFGSSL